MFRRTEISIGILATILSMVGLALVVFGPAVYTYGTNSLTAGPTSLWTYGIDTTVGIYLAVMVAAAVGIGVGTSLRSHAVAGGLSILWASTLTILGGALFTLPGSETAVVPSALHASTPDSVGIGIYLILPAIFGLATAVAVAVSHHAPHQPLAPRPQ